LVPQLMDRVLALATADQERDPLVLAALVSFGFVFIHPFMDGNGRLSRFLVHDVVGRSRRLPQGFVLPISVAMKRHENAYLQALQSYSKPLRDWWRVTWIDDGQYTYEALSNDCIHRYWDATPCVEFLLDMAQEALLHDLTDETKFLLQYDKALQAVEARFDLRSVAVATLLRHAFTNGGKLSNHRRKQFADVVPAAAFDAIESIVTQQLLTDPLPAIDDPTVT
jgi:Fic family protein